MLVQVKARSKWWKCYHVSLNFIKGQTGFKQFTMALKIHKFHQHHSQWCQQVLLNRYNVLYSPTLWQHWRTLAFSFTVAISRLKSRFVWANVPNSDGRLDATSWLQYIYVNMKHRRVDFAQDAHNIVAQQSIKKCIQVINHNQPLRQCTTGLSAFKRNPHW